MYSSGNYGFLIRDAAENGVGTRGGSAQSFHSHEQPPGTEPQLVITFG